MPLYVCTNDPNPVKRGDMLGAASNLLVVGMLLAVFGDGHWVPTAVASLLAILSMLIIFLAVHIDRDRGTVTTDAYTSVQTPDELKRQLVICVVGSALGWCTMLLTVIIMKAIFMGAVPFLIPMSLATFFFVRELGINLTWWQLWLFGSTPPPIESSTKSTSDLGDEDAVEEV